MGGTNEQPAVDVDLTMAQVDQDPVLLVEIIDIFSNDCEELMAQIADAMVKEDGVALADAAHSLKGSASNFGARKTCLILEKIEAMGQKQDFNSMNELFGILKLEMNRVKQALQDLPGQVEYPEQGIGD